MNIPVALAAAGGAYLLAKSMGGDDAPVATGAAGEAKTTEGTAADGAKPDQGGRAPSTVNVTKTTAKTPSAPLKPATVAVKAPSTTVKKPSTSVAGSKPLTETMLPKKAPTKKVSATEAQATARAAINGIAPDLRF